MTNLPPLLVAEQNLGISARGKFIQSLYQQGKGWLKVDTVRCQNDIKARQIRCKRLAPSERGEHALRERRVILTS